MKHDSRYKARLVTGGHLTPPNRDQAYSGVVSLQTMRLALLAGKLNNLKLMVGDIGNAYLESFTREKVVLQQDPNLQIYKTILWSLSKIYMDFEVVEPDFMKY